MIDWQRKNLEQETDQIHKPKKCFIESYKDYTENNLKQRLEEKHKLSNI